MSNEAMVILFLVLWIGTVALMLYMSALILYSIAEIKERIEQESKDKEEA